MTPSTLHIHAFSVKGSSDSYYLFWLISFETVTYFHDFWDFGHYSCIITSERFNFTYIL